MAAKTIFVICAQAFLMQTVYSQCLARLGAGPKRAPYAGPLTAPIAGPLAAPFAGPLAAPLAGPLASPLASPLAARGVPALAAPALAYDGCAGVASTGGGFPVTSASPIAPTGVTVVSENQIEGALAVGGNLPLLGSVAVEGAFPTAGAGAVSYGCGNGEVIITSETPITTGIVFPGPVAPAPAIAGPAFGSALAGPAFGSTLAGPAFGSALAGPAIAPSLGASGLASGLLGARAGIAPGVRRGCGFGGFY